MKTVALAILFVCSCLDVQGQGQVQFRNYYISSTPPVDARVFLDYGRGLPLDGSNPLWRAALLGGPVTGTAACVPGSCVGCSSATAGNLAMLHHPTTTTLTWVNFRTGTTPPAAPGYVIAVSVARMVPGVNWGGQALVQMVAWQGNYDSWADAFAAWQAGTPNVLIGASNPLTLTLPTGPTDPNLTYLIGLQSFTLGQWTPPQPYFSGSAGPDDRTIKAGEPVTLQVIANASPMPYAYQWYFNGTQISGATSSSFTIASVGAGDAGQYYAVMFHLLGTFTSRTSTLTVHVPPVITSSPQSQTSLTGSGAKFRASASGDAPLSYQWYFNGSTPVGTGTSLKLTALQPQHVGAYTVVVGNAWGSVTSAPAMLNVIPPVDMAFAPGVIGHGESGTALNLEFADGLASAMNWQPLTQLAVTNETNTSQAYIDWPRVSPYRLYRAWQTNGVSQPPLLSMQLVPAITLTGAVRSSVRVDYINQIGPMDAWVTLATVTLTNTSQEYFDTSAIGQPARLYRLVTVP